VCVLAVHAVATDSELGSEAESASGVMAQSSILLRHRESSEVEQAQFNQWITQHHQELLANVRTLRATPWLLFAYSFTPNLVAWNCFALSG
jgi:hypothetical protein